MNLQEIIIQKIQDEGQIRFHDFMETCLYYPELGYYTSGRNKIGSGGDFYTSACLTPVFGAMIGKQLEEMWLALGSNSFTIVEYGAGEGSLCHDILDYLQHNEKLYQQLNYCIIEKSAAMRHIERSHLPDKVTWFNSIEEISAITGCILSNELLDNFAVHPVLMEDELLEAYITYENGFKEVWKPASQELKGYLQELGMELSKGFRTEINLQALEWLKTIAQSLTRGFVLTIDYGYLIAELFKQGRSQGTLLGYCHHSISDNLYDHVGQQDITAHVNFSALIHWGEKYGLRTCGYTDQCHFLLGLGFKKALENQFSATKNVIQAARQVSVISHTLLYDMGLKYKVLIQEKGVGEVRFNYNA
ncbi:class I SAM-dependent methyltransferase [Pedobacter immunditicola]|uniref:class I SAM-dependent methyltransferase n=1 Tax=Pedobacter immunditicola TaxID=3133440 RepID=UPI0030A7D11A